jgi:hypothetical protein
MKLDDAASAPRPRHGGTRRAHATRKSPSSCSDTPQKGISMSTTQEPSAHSLSSHYCSSSLLGTGGTDNATRGVDFIEDFPTAGGGDERECYSHRLGSHPG